MVECWPFRTWDSYTTYGLSLSFSPKDILKRGLGREGQGRSLRHKDTTTASQVSEESSDLFLFVSF